MNFLFRYVLWCEAGISNKDPQKIASYFVKALEQANGFTLRNTNTCIRFLLVVCVITPSR